MSAINEAHARFLISGGENNGQPARVNAPRTPVASRDP